ncbi:MAG: DUF4249 family protein [Gracilimonas sp.]
MKNLLFIVLLTVTAITSCDVYTQDDYEEQYVLESYLVANRTLPFVRLSKTAPALDFYDFEETAVSDANIRIQLLENGPGSSVDQTIIYSNNQPGIYTPTQSHEVLPKRTYQIEVSFPGSTRSISAHTVVPDTFQILGGVRDSITYQSSEQLEITLSESSYPGRQNIFVFNALSLRPQSQNLTPLYADLYEDSENQEEELQNFANNSSGIINEGNFERNPDGTFTIRFPWIGIAFYQDNKIVANTLDDNIYDFLRSQEVQLGGSTLSPGEVQSIITHVKGGIGVFGSVASDTVETFVKLPLL